MKNSTQDEVVARLRLIGISLEDWAVANGYPPATLRNLLRVHVGTGKPARGYGAREILGKLIKDLEETKLSEMEDLTRQIIGGENGTRR